MTSRKTIHQVMVITDDNLRRPLRRSRDARSLWMTGFPPPQMIAGGAGVFASGDFSARPRREIGGNLGNRGPRL